MPWNSTMRPSGFRSPHLLIAFISPLLGSALESGSLLAGITLQLPSTSCQSYLASIPRYLDIFTYLHMAYSHIMSDAFQCRIPPPFPPQQLETHEIEKQKEKNIGGALRCEAPRIASCEMTKNPSDILFVSLTVDEVDQVS